MHDLMREIKCCCGGFGAVAVVKREKKRSGRKGKR